MSNFDIDGDPTPEQIRFATKVIRNTPFNKQYDGVASDKVKDWLESVATEIEHATANDALWDELAEEVLQHWRVNGGSTPAAVRAIRHGWELKKRADV
jgi:hypothetical protein